MIRCFEDIDEGTKQSLEPACIMFYILYALSLSNNSHKMLYFFLMFNKKIVCGIVLSVLFLLILFWELRSSQTKPNSKLNHYLDTFLWISYWLLSIIFRYHILNECVSTVFLFISGLWIVPHVITKICFA